MPISTAMTAALLRAEGSRATEFFTSTNQDAMEMSDLINEVARDIVDSHDWRDLTKIHTFTGNGSQTAFPKPADCDRMVLASLVDRPGSWLWGYCSVPSLNDWMTITTNGFGRIEPGSWILLGGEFQFYPAPSGDAQMAYISKNYARSESGTAKAGFESDDDEFVLDDRLLTLGLIWRWKAQKGLEYAEDMATYEMALSRAQGRDKGARVIEKRVPAFSRVPLAWPWELG